MTTEHSIISGTLSKGTYVVLRNTDNGGTSEGTFDGIRFSEWDPDTLYAYFRDGRINGIRQTLFGYPAASIA